MPDTFPPPGTKLRLARVTRHDPGRVLEPTWDLRLELVPRGADDGITAAELGEDAAGFLLAAARALFTAATLAAETVDERTARLAIAARQVYERKRLDEELELAVLRDGAPLPGTGRLLDAMAAGELEAAGEDACRVVEVDGQPVRVHGGEPMTGQAAAAFAELVRAAGRRFAAKENDDPLTRAVAEANLRAFVELGPIIPGELVDVEQPAPAPPDPCAYPGHVVVGCSRCLPQPPR